MKRLVADGEADQTSPCLGVSGSKPKAKRVRRCLPKDKSQNSTPGRRSSIYRGVTRHRWTGRYEAHLWDKNCWNQGQNKKGRQVYLGAYDDEEAAAHTYDLAALKYWGTETILNFPLNSYTKELEEMQTVSKEEYLASLRRRSSGFSRGVSKYRGVARHHHNGRWEARIGRVFGNKYLYLGTYSTQEEAAAAYDMAAIEYRGLNAVTNFDLSRYIGWLRPGQNTSSSDQESGSSPTAINDIQNMTNNNNSYECGSSTSALGLLLQSSKFKEMIERTSVNNIRSTSTTATAHHDLTASASAAAAAAAVQDLQSPSLDTTFSSDEIDMFFDTSDNILVNSDHHLSLSNINVAVESPNNMNMNMNMNIFLQGAHDEADMQQHLHEMPALELHEICSSTGEFFDFDRQGDDIEYPLIDPMSSINSISFPFPIRTCS